MKRISITVLFLFILMSVNAQDLHTAPSLQLGLSGISFSKGTLDAQLIAEIIAEKQSEIRVKLVKSMLLEKIGVTNGLFYAYLDYTIEILTKEKDEQTRIKNLLENTVNISFVVGYTDYYLRTLKKDSAQWNNIKNLALTYFVDEQIFEKEKISLRDFARPLNKKNTKDDFIIDASTEENKKRSKSNEFVGVLIDLVAEQIRQNEEFKSLGILRTNYLQHYVNMNAYLSLKNDVDQNEPELNASLLKSYDLLINRKYSLLFELVDTLKQQHLRGKIKELDEKQFFLIEMGRSELRALLSSVKEDLYNLDKKEQKNYEKVIKESLEIKLLSSEYSGFGSGSSEDDKIDKLPEEERQKNYITLFDEVRNFYPVYAAAFNRRDKADLIFEDVKNNIETYIKYYGLIKSIASKGKDWEASLKLISKNYLPINVEDFTKNLKEQYVKARSDANMLALMIKNEAEAFKTVNSFIENIEFIKLNRYEYIQTYEAKIKPALNRLSVYSLEFMNMNSTLFSILHNIDSSVKGNLQKVNLNTDLSFIDVFTKIDEFDKIETYSAILNQLSDVGDVFSDDKMRKSINLIVGFVRSYIKLSKDTSDKVYINLDVEGFLTSLQKSNYNKFRPLELMFTVGANTTSFQSKYTEGKDTLSSYSFIGEKIGFKYKIWDYKYLNSFSKGETFTYKSWWNFIRVNRITYIRNVAPKEPVISDIHVLAYGTGLLYNLTNTGTTKGFNSPMLAAGVGITFYNDLDFNISYGKPLIGNVSYFSKQNPSFVNIGFDIQFIEYYNRMNDRRKSNKVQKQLLNAM